MWRSLHKRVLGIDPVARISIAIACGLHLLLLIAIMCAELLKPAQQIQISRQLQGAQTPIIIIDPMIKETKIIAAASAGTATPALSTVASSSKAPVQSVQVAQPDVAAKQRRLEKKTTVVASKPKPKQKPAKKTAPKKAPKKTAVPKKKEAPKLKPVETPKKEPEKKIEPPVASTSTPIKEEKVLAPQTAAPEILPALPVSSDGPIIIARSAVEAAAIAVHLEIQNELLRVWHPPIGIDDEITCTVRVIIDKEGTVKSLELTKPSGMLLFDVSARGAIQQAVWPRAVWGTTLELQLQ